MCEILDCSSLLVVTLLPADSELSTRSPLLPDVLHAVRLLKVPVTLRGPGSDKERRYHGMRLEVSAETKRRRRQALQPSEHLHGLYAKGAEAFERVLSGRL